MNTQETIITLKALANERRLQILRLLANTPRGLNVKTIQSKFKIPQPLVSQQLAMLLNAGLVSVKQQKCERIYSVANPVVGKIIKLLQEA